MTLFDKAITDPDLTALAYHKYKQSLSVRANVENPVMLLTHVEVHEREIVSRLALLLEKEVTEMNFRVTIQAEVYFEIAGMILDKYSTETFEDILLALDFFKKGKLSIKAQNIMRISSAVIIDIIDAYLMEHKIPDRETYNTSKHISTDDGERNPLPHAEVAKRARAAIHQMTMRKLERKEKKKVEVAKSPLNSYEEFAKNALKAMNDIPTSELTPYINSFPEEHRKMLTGIANTLIRDRRK